MAWHVTSPPPGTFMVSSEQGQPDDPVLAIAIDDDLGETRYLVARQYDKPEWISHEKARSIWVSDRS